MGGLVSQNRRKERCNEDQNTSLTTGSQPLQIPTASSHSSSASINTSINAVQKEQSFVFESEMALVERTNEGRQPRRSTRRDASPEPVGKSVQRRESVCRIPYYEESIASSRSSRDSIFEAHPAKPENIASDQPFPLMSGALPLSSPKYQSPKIHVPHKLETILEQKSIISLRQATSLTLRQKASVLSQLSRKTSINTLRARAKFRRRFSFSVSDLTSFQVFKKFLKQSISTSTSSGRSFPITNTYPAVPVEEPPRRTPTPPGLPTFNSSRALNYRLPPPPTRFRDAIRCHSGEDDEQYMRQTVGLPRGVVMRGEDGIMIRGAFKIPSSGQTYRPTIRPGSVARDENGFATGSSQSRNVSLATSTVPSRRDDDTSGLAIIPSAIPERISSKKATTQTPKRRTSLLTCCCCCCCNIDDYVKEQRSGDGEGERVENENLEALRSAISGHVPVI